MGNNIIAHLIFFFSHISYTYTLISHPPHIWKPTTFTCIVQISNNNFNIVWIEFILLKLKTENWKYCSKLIFKCVNNTVGPIFNEKVAEKWNLWVRKQCTDTLFTDKKSTSTVTKKKNVEMRWKQNVDAISRIQTSPNSLLNFQLFLQYSLSLSIISLSLWVSLINMGMYKSSKQRLQFRIYLDYKLGISHSLLLPKKSGWK